MTPQRAWDDFLATLSTGSSVTAACEASGLTRQTAYRRRQADEAFALAWADAIDRGTERLEDFALKRALSGESDRILELLLKAHRPDKYRDRVSIDATHRRLPTDRIRRVQAAAQADPEAWERIAAAIGPEEEG